MAPGTDAVVQPASKCDLFAYAQIVAHGVGVEPLRALIKHASNSLSLEFKAFFVSMAMLCKPTYLGGTQPLAFREDTVPPSDAPCV